MSTVMSKLSQLSHGKAGILLHRHNAASKKTRCTASIAMMLCPTKTHQEYDATKLSRNCVGSFRCQVRFSIRRTVVLAYHHTRYRNSSIAKNIVIVNGICNSLLLTPQNQLSHLCQIFFSELYPHMKTHVRRPKSSFNPAFSGTCYNTVWTITFGTGLATS